MIEVFNNLLKIVGISLQGPVKGDKFVVLDDMGRRVVVSL